MTKAAFAGSFDPITTGHLWLIEQGSKLFDHLEVIVAENPSKKYLLGTDQRVQIAKSATAHLSNVTVTLSPAEYVATYADSQDIDYLLRGIRAAGEFDYEMLISQTNQELLGGPQTVFLTPPRDLGAVSSSFVKSLIGPGGWQWYIKQFLHKAAYEAVLVGWLKQREQRMGLGSAWTETHPYKGAIYLRDNFLDGMVAQYTKPHRHYHTLAHLVHLFTEFDAVVAARGFDTVGRYMGHNLVGFPEVEAALWFHDYIYDPQSQGNEEASAEEARLFLDEGTPGPYPIFTQGVVDLIRATRHEFDPEDASEWAKLMVSLDLAILGRPAKEYELYTQAVWQEYSMYPEDQFNMGRAMVLQQFLDRPVIYHDPMLNSLYEKQARNNLRNELYQIEQRMK